MVKNSAKIIHNALKETFSNKDYIFLFILIFMVFLSIYILIPVFAVPGNDILFQLKTFGFKDYAIIVPLSLITGLMLTLQVYSFKKYRKIAKETGTGLIGGYSGIVSGLFGSATCVSCVSALFGFLGTGGVFFLVNNRWWVVSIGMALVLMSLFFTSKRINDNASCKIEVKSNKTKSIK